MKVRAIQRFPAFVLAPLLAFSLGCVPAPPPPAPTTTQPYVAPTTVELKAVTVEQLDAEIASLKGNVVLIDVWFLGCAPCVKRFPHFVEMQGEFGSEGLACVSLNVYSEELKAKERVLEFLKQKNALTRNLIVDDSQPKLDAWQKKYDAEGTPSYVIFDRQGKWVKTPQPEDKENVSKLLKKLLAEK